MGKKSSKIKKLLNEKPIITPSKKEERINFSYSGVNIDYDIDYYHDDRCDEWACRCSKIVDTKVESVEIESVVESLISKLGIEDNEVNRYIIDRILRIEKVYEKDKWEIEVTGGYYGQEIEGVYLNDDKAIFDKIREATSLKTTTDKINYVLKLEYGYLLPRFEKAQWELVEIDIKDIRYRQSEYRKKVTVEPWYEEFELPIGVVDENLGLIDGYHRTLACHKTRAKVFRAVL